VTPAPPSPGTAPTTSELAPSTERSTANATAVTGALAAVHSSAVPRLADEWTCPAPFVDCVRRPSKVRRAAPTPHVDQHGLVGRRGPPPVRRRPRHRWPRPARLRRHYRLTDAGQGAQAGGLGDHSALRKRSCPKPPRSYGHRKQKLWPPTVPPPTEPCPRSYCIPLFRSRRHSNHTNGARRPPRRAASLPGPASDSPFRNGQRPVLGGAHRASGLASGQRPPPARPQRGAGYRRAGAAARSTCRPCCHQRHRCSRPRRNRSVADRRRRPAPGVDRPVVGLLQLPGPETGAAAVQPRDSADPSHPVIS
jgi:hypothetical protein